MQPHKTYALADVEGALHACNSAVVQTRRGHGGPILTLAELKADSETLTSLMARARAAPGQALSFHDIGEILPRLAYWVQQAAATLPVRSEIVKARGG